MHPSQDAGCPVDGRVEDLFARMPPEEKAGHLFPAILTMNADGTPVTEPGDTVRPTAPELIAGRGLTPFDLLGGHDARATARWHDAVQEIAADTRLGIPVSLSTDPRHAFTDNIGASFGAGPFSAWPEALGLAAVRDPELVFRFADTVRREYLSAGFRTALHPQIDLATEPRRSRRSGTFGSDAKPTGEPVEAYARGLQGERLGPDSVAAMVEHFPGGGPQEDGEDPHFPHGKEQVHPGGMRDHHLEPFRAAIAAGCSQMMPYYGQPVGTDREEVGFGFDKGVVTGLLREEPGFDGIVCTDRGLLTDSVILGEPHEARAWGVEHPGVAERAAKALDAGVDQSGGEQCPGVIVELMASGRVPEARIDASVRRLLREKFLLGLFDERRYADPDEAAETVGRADFAAAGAAARRRSLTIPTRGPLPLAGAPRPYADGVDPAAAAAYGEAVAAPAGADLAVLRLRTPHPAPRAPHEERPNRFESLFHSGSLAFAEPELGRILGPLATVPTVVCVHLERPAVLPEIAEHAAALLADYGASDEAVLDVVFGRARPQGRLPFELPRSMEAVRAARPDVPNDTADPVFPHGHGLEL
ncbi:glycoside hydrolase family 3 protein [Streptomyces omiyaensis]|uniref:beta-glucosidase n=1 Tax=Streptomyces omiyaensis TaxID=68247 RepID=A0ABW7BTV5_9ACTN